MRVGTVGGRVPMLTFACVALCMAAGMAAPSWAGQWWVEQSCIVPGDPPLKITAMSHFYGYQSGVDRDLTGGSLAYDYSVHIIRDGGIYRMWVGARWKRPGVRYADGDHVLQYVSRTGEGGTWRRLHNRPEVWQGREEGYDRCWFSLHYLEPEVVKVGGVYYMFTQTCVPPGWPLDLPGLTARTQADRIQLHTSRDAIHWTRVSWWPSVVVNVDRPAYTNLHHQEVIYVPWDPDGRPWWMYVAVGQDGRHRGHVLIRSRSPRWFNFRAREPVIGFSQFGNQVGYAQEAPGGPLFVRITFAGDSTGRAVPALQFSRDGRRWTWGRGGPLLLDGSKDNQHNRNCYFLGISTVDGTGRLEYLGGGLWRAIYGATTCNRPVAPEIFWAEVGVGELLLKAQPLLPEP